MGRIIQVISALIFIVSVIGAVAAGLYSLVMLLNYAYQATVLGVESAVSVALWWLLVTVVAWSGGIGVVIFLGAVIGGIGGAIGEYIARKK